MKKYRVLKPHWVGKAGFGGSIIERDPKDPETVRLVEGGAIVAVEGKAKKAPDPDVQKAIEESGE